MPRRSSRRSKKVPNRFNDMIHELNMDQNIIGKDTNEDVISSEKEDRVKSCNQHSTVNPANIVNDIVIVDCVSEKCVDNSAKEVGSMIRNSYVNALNKDLINSVNKLCLVPTGVNEKGDEVVVFDEELVREGVKSGKILCVGYFVGGSMPVYVIWV
ncbi:hypothetical protein Tco_0090474 [Tanacetum coccineum]